MSLGLVGKKIGMTRIFTEAGVSIPVTVLEIAENRVVRVKTEDKDGYSAVQITVGDVKAKRLNKPRAGEFSAAGVAAGRGLKEFRVAAGELAELAAGNEVGIEMFSAGQKVDVTGTSKGKGFAGTVKRWNFHMQDATHGNSLSHRAPGSIGQCQTPGRVFKGKKMAGQMGNKQVTSQTLEVVRVDAEKRLILVKGAVPGAPGGDIVIKPAVKAVVKGVV